jgi:hypothetical protein
MPDQYVLDYSSGWPAPDAIKAGRYVGVVRYVGTPGRGKNLTNTEASLMRGAGIPIALVYEQGAGWMRGGAPAGAAAARAALADAKVCGVGVRCVYFAADFDVTSAAQMSEVERCLDGAAGVLGRSRVGVYGEADVIDACVGGGHAAYGWQTRAWSSGRLSGHAHLLQLVGYVYPDGVQADRSIVLKPDWGQWPAPGGAAATGEDITIVDAETRKYLDGKFAELNHGLGVVIWGDAPDVEKNPDGTPKDRGGHPFNLEALRGQDTIQGKQIAELAATNRVLVEQLAAQSPNLTVEQITEAIAAGVVRVRVEVTGQQQPDQPGQLPPAAAPTEGGQA